MESLECALALGVIGAGFYVFDGELSHSLSKHMGHEVSATVRLDGLRETEEGKKPQQGLDDDRSRDSTQRNCLGKTG